jgi:acyl-CoA thioester hydrolase
MSFTWSTRIYYQHTDAGGVVFHGAYLNFMEAGRTEMMRSLGFDVADMVRREGLVFVVHRLNLVYRSPARLGDVVEVSTVCRGISGARLQLEQVVRRDDQELVTAEITLVCVNAADFRPTAVPGVIKAAFSNVAVGT